MATTAPPPTRTVTLTIDGREVKVAEDTTIWDAAKQAGIELPVLCHDESCGKCVACRLGSHKAHEILVELLESGGDAGDVDQRIVQLEETPRLTSICGLGQVALGPVISVLAVKRGATEARPHPRTERAPEEDGGDPQLDGGASP